MIKFSNWNIEAIGQVLGRQYDNLTRELRVEGIIPEGWTWDLLVQAGKNLDIIRLNQGENSLSVMLTSEMLALAGYYVLQLRATQGEKVRHTNSIRVFVPESISGDAKWPEVPMEFTQAEQRIMEYNQNPPMPGDNGFWLLWNVDADEYVESDIPLPEAGSGGSGGYYTPSVGQPDENTMRVSFTPSKDGMDSVEPVNVALPKGPPGPNGETPKRGVDYWTEADKQEIVAATVAALPVYNGEVQDGA